MIDIGDLVYFIDTASLLGDKVYGRVVKITENRVWCACWSNDIDVANKEFNSYTNGCAHALSFIHKDSIIPVKLSWKKRMSF